MNSQHTTEDKMQYVSRSMNVIMGQIRDEVLTPSEVRCYYTKAQKRALCQLVTLGWVYYCDTYGSYFLSNDGWDRVSGI
jgi:hypothetical protein